ncbi:MAG: hypothetical protein IPN29_05830 [Saprospiraceae bacterium]|nr:hypothetical protein [Saprospiraceae bacterium]
MTYKEMTSKWWFHGLRWGLLMLLADSLLFPWIFQDTFRWSRFFIGIPIWMLGGLTLAYATKKEKVENE